MALQISYPASEYLGEVDHFKVGDAPQSVLDLPDTGALARHAGASARRAGASARRAGALARCAGALARRAGALARRMKQTAFPENPVNPVILSKNPFSGS